MRNSVAAAFEGTAADTFGMDGKIGRYEFDVGVEGILPEICRLHFFIKRHGTFTSLEKLIEMDIKQ